MSEVSIQHLKTHWNVRLNRPEKHNAFTPKMIQELTEFFVAAGKDSSARYILISGAGPSFCAGADLEWMKSMAKYKLKENQEDAERLFQMFEAGMNCDLPIITTVHGNVFGGGLGILAVSDIVIAESATNFCFSETRLGLVPAVISSFVLRKMKPNKARELMMTAEVFDCKTAFESGLIEYFGRELETQNRLKKLTKQFLLTAPEAVRDAKKLFEVVRLSSFEEAKKESISLIANRRMSKEGQEGMQSFIEKRKPNWVLSSPKSDEEEE